MSLALAPASAPAKSRTSSPLAAWDVYRAVDTRLDRTIAITAHVADPVLRQRFEREARAISSLDHPHICTLYDVGQHEDATFLVMQFLEGRPSPPARTRAPTDRSRPEAGAGPFRVADVR